MPEVTASSDGAPKSACPGHGLFVLFSCIQESLGKLEQAAHLEMPYTLFDSLDAERLPDALLFPAGGEYFVPSIRQMVPIIFTNENYCDEIRVCSVNEQVLETYKVEAYANLNGVYLRDLPVISAVDQNRIKTFVDDRSSCTAVIARDAKVLQAAQYNGTRFRNCKKGTLFFANTKLSPHFFYIQTENPVREVARFYIREEYSSLALIPLTELTTKEMVLKWVSSLKERYGAQDPEVTISCSRQTLKMCLDKTTVIEVRKHADGDNSVFLGGHPLTNNEEVPRGNIRVKIEGLPILAAFHLIEGIAPKIAVTTLFNLETASLPKFTEEIGTCRLLHLPAKDTPSFATLASSQTLLRKYPFLYDFLLKDFPELSTEDIVFILCAVDSQVQHPNLKAGLQKRDEFWRTDIRTSVEKRVLTGLVHTNVQDYMYKPEEQKEYAKAIADAVICGIAKHTLVKEIPDTIPIPNQSDEALIFSLSQGGVEVAEELNRRAQGKPFIIFRRNEIDREGTLHLLKDIRKKVVRDAYVYHDDFDDSLVFAITVSDLLHPSRVNYVCPLNLDHILTNGYCQCCKLSFHRYSLEERALITTYASFGIVTTGIVPLITQLKNGIRRAQPISEVIRGLALKEDTTPFTVKSMSFLEDPQSSQQPLTKFFNTYREVTP